MLKKYCFFLPFVLCFSIKSQYSVRLTAHENLYQNAFLEYQNAYYLSAENALESLEKNAPQHSDKEYIDYYKILSIVKQHSKDTEFWIDYFIKKYPTSIFRNNFLLEIGQYYYHSDDSSLALKWLNKVDKKLLNQHQEDAYNFTMGYALFLLKEYTRAKGYFLPLTYRSQYKENACYYYGYIAYSEADHLEALRYFKKIQNPALKKMVAYYKMVISYLEKNYDEVLKIKTQLKEISDAYLGKKGLAKKVYLLAGHSYFQMQAYKKAALLFQKVLKKNTLQDYWHVYTCGYAFYKIKNYAQALKYFQRVVVYSKELTSDILQNTIYNMGICHMRLGKKSSALLDFKKVCEIPTKDSPLQKDAYFNYAKLGYEIGNPYQNPTEVLKAYTLKYPNSGNALIIKKLIVDSYFKIRDFKGVLRYYESAKMPSDNKKQKAFLFLGMQEFQKENYKAALLYFENAGNQLFDLEIRSQARYWKANTLYELQNFKKALLTYIQLKRYEKSTTHKNIDYDIGYTYFKLKKYVKAAQHFEKYLKKNVGTTRKINNSYLRLADSYFAIKAYKKALKNYNYILLNAAVEQDYAQLQKSLCYGFMDKIDLKIQTLNTFIIQYPKSTYNDEVLFILGNTYLQNENYKAALATYDKLIKLFDNSPFFASCMLKKGLIYYNLNQSERALEQYKRVVKKFHKTRIAQQAMADIKRIYIETDKVEAYAQWVKTLHFLSVSQEDLDDTMYQAAENLYLDHKQEKATESFEKYLANFPQGIHSVQVHFYLGGLYFEKKQWDAALPHYNFVLEKNISNYLEPSLVRVSEIYLNTSEWEKALAFLKKIVRKARNEEVLIFAKKNLVQVTFEKTMYRPCVHYAKDLMENYNLDTQLANQMRHYIAKSAMALKDFDLAKKYYLKLSENAMGSIKAEAMYYVAYFLHNEKKYKKSNQEIQKIAAAGMQDLYWNTRSLVLMARNYQALNDTFEARYILEHLSKNTEIPKALLKEIDAFLLQMSDTKNLKNNNTPPAIDSIKASKKTYLDSLKT